MINVTNKPALKSAVQAALAGDWAASHQIAQAYDDAKANWLHAVLHKIEGDEWNSKYWYARTAEAEQAAKRYDDFVETVAELNAILKSLA